MQQPVCLGGQRLGDDRMRVAEAGDSQAGQEIEVALVVAIVELDALTSDELHRRRSIGGHDRAEGEVGWISDGIDVAHWVGPFVAGWVVAGLVASAVILVPIPASVNSSSNIT